ncbi:hypothetical protein [Thalassospira alkalitolerans]|uniref:hypothetical protein n=1 Tax=Thalassospira alkalitolerans TaxID=1293890 RepID=UPI0030ECF98C|tara:strand:+ start:887 stop:1321 length:435 start_codon:yes stop_codon:yes gene_type:complete
MTSQSNIQEDVSKILIDAKWLIEGGFEYRLENEYTLQFAKDEIVIRVYYGRYSDSTDVLIEIDAPKSERYLNGNPTQYSVFEGLADNQGAYNFSTLDGYDKAKAGLNILREDKNLFDINYLRKTRLNYQKNVRSKLPKQLRDLI